MPEIKGIIKSRSEVGFTSNDKKKVTFILDCSNEFGSNFLEFVLYGDKCSMLKRYRNKEEIYVMYSPRGFISEKGGKEKLIQSLSASHLENETERDMRKIAAAMGKRTKKK